MSSRKGPAFERRMCQEISEWFSGGRSQDWFWRSSTSGGRATVRGRKGKTTTGHCGDVAATCPQGERLTRLLTLELKRGYGKKGLSTMPHVMLDRPNGCGQQQFEAWVQQAEASRQLAGSFGWLLMYQRDKREAVVVMERRTERALIRHGAFRTRPLTKLTIDSTFRFELKDTKTGKLDRVWYPRQRLTLIGLQDFFELVPPQSIKSLNRELRV